MNFEITDNINEQDKEMIYQGLLEYNLARIEDKVQKDLGVYLQDETGKILAGLIGTTHGNWLFVKYLWVSEDLRGQNIGSQILKQAEEKAKERGCKYAFLDTFSFQAPEFYKKQGYKEVFVLEEYPVTGKRYYFTKTLA
jgi:GNAT superfamily N-acetyltransferase